MSSRYYVEPASGVYRWRLELRHGILEYPDRTTFTIGYRSYFLDERVCRDVAAKRNAKLERKGKLFHRQGWTP